ncbi:MAG: endonuclease/exonuclease/phosphatase, partial [Bacteroidota bacterium]
MRTFWLLISLFVLLSCGARPQVPGTDRGTAPLTIMSYNIRLDTDRDRANAWPNRREFLANQILFHAPEVLGIQEGLPQQVKWLDRRLANYAVTGEGRRGGNKGEYSAIYYDRRRLRAEDAGTFWLSETPQRVSTGWDAALPRICTWVRFRRL